MTWIAAILPDRNASKPAKREWLAGRPARAKRALTVVLADDTDPHDDLPPARDGCLVSGGLAHGVADWPFGSGRQRPRPDSLPDGRPWPSVRVVIVEGPSGGVAASVASIVAQGYAELRHDLVAVGPRDAVLADPRTDYVFALRAGDLLAPGAVTALVVEAVLSRADAVAGLRVLFDDTGVHGLDVLTLDRPTAPADDDGSGILFARTALARVLTDDAGARRSMGEAWARLSSNGGTFARVGRPVLLHRTAAEPPAASHALRIASLTDLGHRGGAGIAQRRLTEALALCEHAVGHVRLADEAPPAAAEWTERFPATEAAIVGRHDLVLAGNLHASTRSTAIVGELSRNVPVASVLHDLFALTGRCAHPRDCPVIATGCDPRCPTPDAYPQLAPRRIARAFAKKRSVLSGAGAPMLLANSDWTEARARALAPSDARIGRIALAFPTGVFRPGDKAALRRTLGLPADDLLVVFSAVIADAPDKGFDDLAATLRAVARPGIGFVALGRLDDPSALGVANLHAPGPIGDETRLAQWYAACDICLTASRLETLGQTPIEAGLCGVPAVAYRATGLTSAVLDGVTGVLVEPRAGALAAALAALIADRPRRERLGAFARIVLESRFSHASCAMSLHTILAEWDRLHRYGTRHRLRFLPEMLARFAFAEHPDSGFGDTVAPPSGPAFRALRRFKHAAIGRGMPLWVRRARYLLARLLSVRNRR